jgi:hypothetical protein
VRYLEQRYPEVESISQGHVSIFFPNDCLDSTY